MYDFSDSVEDVVMKKLAALIQTPLPNSAHRARSHLLEQLGQIEIEILNSKAHPCMLHVIRSVQDMVRRSDALM